MSNGKELVIERVFDAPREMVWRFWTEPELFMKWWGPEHFTSPTCVMDVRVGGKYLWCMRGPDGKDFYSTGVFSEVAPVEKLAYTDSFADPEGNAVPASYYGMEDFPMESFVTVVLEELSEGKTKMVVKHIGVPEGEMGENTQVGWNQSFDKMATALQQ
jgi:uncharacterized protein YndB with AHSA1/START domain